MESLVIHIDEIFDKKLYFTKLVQYIYDNIDLETVECKMSKFGLTKTFCNILNEWYNPRNRVSLKSLIKCDKFMKGMRNKYYMTPISDIKYNLRFEEIRKLRNEEGEVLINYKFEDYEEDESKYEILNKEHINKIISINNYFKENMTDDLNNVIFISKYKLKLVNTSGFNYDTRGSDNTIINLDFHSEYILNENFTLYDLAIGCYKIKSHKFDKWYELFLGCVETNLIDGELVINLSFDHGS